jgi:hypothetical protein
VALYGVDALVAAKRADLKGVLLGVMDEEKIRLREEVAEQIRRGLGVFVGGGGEGPAGRGCGALLAAAARRREGAPCVCTGATVAFGPAAATVAFGPAAPRPLSL